MPNFHAEGLGKGAGASAALFTVPDMLLKNTPASRW